MTAKEEDILTNQSFISNGVVLDKLFQALIVTPCDYNDITLGDKNAIMIAARVLGYGKDYEFEYDAIRFSYKVFACIDAYQKTKPDMMWYLDADIITFEKIPMSWLEHIIPDHAFTSYLGRPKKGFSETGYYAFNTAHAHAEDFFNRWSEYYEKDLYFNIQKGFLDHFPRTGYTDSFTFDAVRLEFEQAGKMINEDLNDGRWAGSRKARHPFINSELGQYMDHLKGFDRKEQMQSKKSDLTTRQEHKYWNSLK